MMAFDIASFINQYYIDPIVSGHSYNVVNTLTYALILGVSLFALLKLLKFFNVKIDERLIIATSPYIVLGASSRVLQDVNILSPPASYLFITPFVYIVAFAVTAIALFTFLWLERSHVIKDYRSPYFATGIVGTAIVVAVLFTQPLDRAWTPIAIFALATILTGIVYLAGRSFKLGFLTMPLNVAIIFGQLFDASATYTAIDLVGGFSEKHVVPSLFIGITNSAAVMFVLKIAVFIPVLYLIEKYMAEDKELYYILKFALLVLGFGPGIRDMLQLLLV